MFRETCAQIPKKYREEAGIAAAKLFKQSVWFNNHDHFACYLPTQHEFDAFPIIEAIWQAKKSCYIPALIPNTKTLQFLPFAYGDPLHYNRYHILEPINIENPISPNDLQVVIAPLIAFDLQGHRLGTGGGYYDRTFANLNIVPPILLGLGFAAQGVSETLPFDPWDIVLQGIITEQKIIDCKM
ncbi:MAG: 5-formyltetrahydrofolate cyclo-ligase [Gammaproteobacteria bacterium]|nr:5-formyltetrahydrofolate cyclo-ligase [Gammaproteobacteria bacterium]